MLPAAAIIMLHLAVGPFAHPSLLHWHQRFARLLPTVRYPLVILAVITLITGTFHLLGFLPA